MGSKFVPSRVFVSDVNEKFCEARQFIAEVRNPLSDSFDFLSKFVLRSVGPRCFSTAPVHRGKVYVVGVGMTKFEKPGKREDFDYPDMAQEAVTNALKDAGVEYKDVEQAAVGYVYGDSTCGQRALYPLGMTGIPVSFSLRHFIFVMRLLRSTT